MPLVLGWLRKGNVMLTTSTCWLAGQIVSSWCSPPVSSRKGCERNEADRLRTTIRPRRSQQQGSSPTKQRPPGESTLGRRCSAKRPPSVVFVVYCCYRVHGKLPGFPSCVLTRLMIAEAWQQEYIDRNFPERPAFRAASNKSCRHQQPA